MRLAARFVWLVLIFLTSPSLSFAQSQIPPYRISPLELNSDPTPVQIPRFADYGEPHCDDSDTIYIRYIAKSVNAYTSALSRVEPDGSTQNVTLGPLSKNGNDHVFQFAVSEYGTPDEIVRSEDPDSDQVFPQIYYAQFENDGELRSKAAFKSEFIPSVLLPLPSGDFFAAGVTLQQKAEDDIEENPSIGIFGPDARLKASLRRQTGFSDGAPRYKTETVNPDNPLFQGGSARLGTDGNIYLLEAGSATKVEVVSQSGLILREFTLLQPFQEGLADGMWVSGARILVSYEGEADNPRDSITYALYDSTSGEFLRAFRPQYSGTIACFDAGQTVTVLIPDKQSGTLSIGRADLQ